MPFVMVEGESQGQRYNRAPSCACTGSPVSRPKPVMLLILDGWGHREDAPDNAISQADCPNWRRLLARCPHTLIETSGLHVGLPDGQMGNSEVGHMNLGAGRIVYQDLTRIDKAIADGEFQRNPELLAACAAARDGGKTLHLFGLLSPGGVHSHEDHILAMLAMARAEGVADIAVHAFLDGRDTPPRSAEPSLAKLQAACAAQPGARIASVCGRYYAMDRDQRWDRVQLAWRALVEGEADYRAADAPAALQAAYARGENDEFVKPTVIGASAPMRDGDAVVFMNFRADRARQLSAAFVRGDFAGFDRGRVPKLARFVCLTEYAADLPASVAFGPETLRNTLPEVLAAHGLTQLRIAETEKYAHVTFFFSGGREEPLPGESRILVPSPRVATYDLQPEMSAPEVTDRLVEAITGQSVDLIVCNLANPDMVGHTGILAAAIQAVEAVDVALGRIVAAIEQVGGELIITADHGNLEQMSDPATGQAHTAHTNGPVPLVYVGRPARLHSGGALRDVAPTLLHLLGIAPPAEMSGRSLVEFR
jgi:2,3-bisphosphoglycerate-independent phosphoglycerate mutase